MTQYLRVQSFLVAFGLRQLGIRPEVAQTIISLGLDFAAIATYPNLQEAVEALLPGSIGRGLNNVGLAN